MEDSSAVTFDRVLEECKDHWDKCLNRCKEKRVRAARLRDNALKAIHGSRGAPKKRVVIERIYNSIVQMLEGDGGVESADAWTRRRMRKKLEGLVAWMGMLWDEHGSTRGDHRSTRGLDYVSPKVTKPAPYCDLGNAGLGLIEVTRKRVYATSCKWWPSCTSSRFLIGRNENGTFFAHSVGKNCGTVLEALQWMWCGRAHQIIARQGDIALIKGKSGPVPTLPSGHERVDESIVHKTHPPIPSPGRGQRIIVARRAAVKAASETRD